MCGFNMRPKITVTLDIRKTEAKLFLKGGRFLRKQLIPSQVFSKELLKIQADFWPLQSSECYF